MMIILVIALFSSFFVMCGSTHFMSVIHFFYPKSFEVLYFQSCIMIICAIVSMLAAVVGFWVFPVILKYLDKFEFSSEGTLQHHDTYLLEAIEMIQESIVILTPDLKIVRGNQASKIIFGEISINTDISDCIHPTNMILFLNTMNMFLLLISNFVFHSGVSIKRISHSNHLMKSIRVGGKLETLPRTVTHCI